MLFVAGITGIASIEFLASSWNERTPILQLPAALIGLPLPIGMALMALYAVDNLRRDHGRWRWRRRGFVAVMTRRRHDPRHLAAAARAAMPRIIAALILFFVAIFAGVPVGFVLLLSTAIYLWATGRRARWWCCRRRMVDGTGNFILLAVPFFILAGLIMERGGISVRLVRFVQALVGHLRGGLLQVTVVSMYVVSGLSGSKPADVAAVGTVMRDMLAARAMAPREGAAVLAASAVDGRDGAAEHRHADRRLDHQCLGGRHVHRRPDAGGGDCALPDGADLLSARAAPTRRAPRARRGAVLRARPRRHAAAADAGHAARRHPAGLATPTEIAALAVVYGLVLSMRRLSRDGSRSLPAHRRSIPPR